MILELTVKELRDVISERGLVNSLKEMRKHTIPTNVLRELYDTEPNFDEISFIAGYPLSPSQLLEQIAQKHEDQDLIALLSVNPRTPKAVLNNFASHETPDLRKAIASNKLLASREISKLLKDASHGVRLELAKNPALKAQHQAFLLKDEEPAIRLALSQNASIIPELAIALLKDSSPLVRTQSLAKAKLPDNFLEWIADSDDEALQLTLLQKPRLPDTILKKLHYSMHLSVRHAVRSLKNSKIADTELSWLAESDNFEDRLFVVERKNLSVPIQRILATDVHAQIRYKLALRDDLDETLATQIAVTNDIAACKGLVENPQLSETLLDILCEHENDEVLLRLAYREDLRFRHLNTLINERMNMAFIRHFAVRGGRYADMKIEVAQELLEDMSTSIRSLAASAISLPPTRLEKLSTEAMESLRMAVAANYNTPKTCLFRLGDDTSEAVAKQAKQTLKELDEFETQQKENSSNTTSKVIPKKRGLIGQFKSLLKK